MSRISRSRDASAIMKSPRRIYSFRARRVHWRLDARGPFIMSAPALDLLRPPFVEPVLVGLISRGETKLGLAEPVEGERRSRGSDS